MGCEKCKCLKCKATIKGTNHLDILLTKSNHEKKFHPEIYEKNRKAQEKFDIAYRKANQKLIEEQEIIFTPTKWDGHDSV